MKEYRVITQSDTFWGDRFDAMKLEAGLNRLARDGWEVKAITSSEHFIWSGIGPKRGELCIVLEREARAVVATASSTSSPSDYDPTKIPSERYYKDLGRITSALKEAGLVDERALGRAREEMATRGGHICDHLLAAGAIDDDRLRRFCREMFEINC